MGRVLISIGALVLLGVVSCSVFLPERFAVNAPMGSLLGMLGIGDGVEPPPESEFQQRIRVPEGFEIDIFAEGIRNARFLRFTSSGDLLVSSPRLGTVFLVERDANGDGRADGVRPLLENLDRPHGLEFGGDWLYVAEGSAVRRIRYDAARREVVGDFETIVSGLPSGGNHWTRTVRIGPDGKLYVSVGSSCNVCVEEDARRAAMLRFNLDGSGAEIYASGLRNSVGFDWQPGTDALFATDNGRDLLGDDFPPCELNEITEGAFYGWPYANGFGVPDPDLGDAPDAQVGRSPAHGFGAHTAPLGMDFYEGSAFPERFRGVAFVVLHGSWNRTRKSGYKVVMLEWLPESDGIRESDFVAGFELDEDVIGRPVDVLEGPDGAVYVSDDYAGAIYRVYFKGS